MDDIALAENRIQQLVASIAVEEGVDPKQFLFTWEKSDLVLQEHGLRLSDKVFNLRIYLEKKSRTLAISEFLVQTVLQNPETFISAHKDAIVAALKKLTNGSLEMRPSRC